MAKRWRRVPLNRQSLAGWLAVTNLKYFVSFAQKFVVQVSNEKYLQQSDAALMFDVWMLDDAQTNKVRRILQPEVCGMPFPLIRLGLVGHLI